MATVRSVPADADARARALALEQSFIVRAPAGSGKTDLLTRRFLKLLAAVDEPEEVLAITFTRAATAEMRTRILKQLEEASRLDAVPDEDEPIRLARAALAHSEVRGWRLLEQPHRLNIETIDSLCLRIAHSQPLLSRMGGLLSPSENARSLYSQAARRTLGLLGQADRELDAALRHLLLLRDNNLLDCERLIAWMLAQRDQWVRAFPLTGNMGEDEWDHVRSRLERPFREEVGRVHAEVHERLMLFQLTSELLELAHHACEHGNQEMAALMGVHSPPSPEAVAAEQWRCISRFLLTGDEWRKAAGLNKTAGFPSKTAEQKKMKARMGKLLTSIQHVSGLREALCAARDLPEPRYEEKQWETLRQIFITLRRAVAELSVLFAEKNTVDFTEVSLAAAEVLQNAAFDPDALLALSGNIRHILVDEFQDTSWSQHELLTLLIRAWEADDGRTCFLVGDPMQSIYLFRQAEVELFALVTRNGLVCAEHTLHLEPLELVTNFRSHAGLTGWWNEAFDPIFAAGGDGRVARVSYSHSIAAEDEQPGEGVHVYPQVLDAAGRKSATELAVETEAEQVLSIIDEHQGRIKKAIEEGGEYRVAVLARTRSHLAKIVSLLRERGIPFRAVELEKLNEQQELLDLLSMVRALLHPMDRVAWLSVLRAPWCGLTLEDLHALTGADDSAFRNVPVLELIESRADSLTQDGAARLQRVARILRQAIAVRFEGLHAHSFSQWIERTWRSLGGPQCVGTTAYENAQVFFTMLDAVTPDGMVCLTDEIEGEMARLFAQPDPGVSERAGVQIMTIHKAKGLGFDVVIVPGLDRGAGFDWPPLICSLERTDPETGETEMLVAPIGGRGDDKHPTYAWVQKQRELRSDEELKRLLYVACTRARRSLHLLGTAVRTRSGVKPADQKNLLTTAWPALQVDFEAAQVAEDKERMGRLVAFPQGDEEAVIDIAATAETGSGENLQSKLCLRRLPIEADLRPHLSNVAFASTASGATETVMARPEGSRDARQKGSVIHALLEQISRGVPLESLRNIARTLLRTAAYSGKTLEDAVSEVLASVENCLGDPDGAWILALHPQAQSEVSWTGWMNGTLETVRADRVFVAGPVPRAPGENHLWIVDYKTSAPAGNALFLVEQREIYAPQLARYAGALREAQGITLPVCYGLYYPRIARLDWWRAEGS